ncbi:aminoglycoside phosphotransferase family protein [Streptomyces sp. NPDC001537]
MGHHNMNHVQKLGQPLARLLGERSGQVRAKFRTPLPTIEVVQRTWAHESDILKAVAPYVSRTPRCLADFGELSVYSYVPGRVLSDAVEKGTIGRDRLGQLADFFAELADVPPDVLPPRPPDWPLSGDSLGFLHHLARFVASRVHWANLPRFGELFRAVGIPDDAMERFLRAVPSLTSRPFILLHTDVHRGNLVLTPGLDGEQIVVIDWELGMYGDPMHDLAIHVVRMDYEETERDHMVQRWAEAMHRTGHSAVTQGLAEDLPVYLGFEYAQSVFPDVMRAALTLSDHPTDQEFADAATRICRAVRRAREPLGLPYLQVDEEEAVVALRRWHASEQRAAMAAGSRKGSRGWDEPREQRNDKPQNPHPRGGAVATAARWLIGATWLIGTAWLLG